MIEKQANALATHANRSKDLTLELSDVAVPMAEEYFVKIVDELVQNALKFSEPGTPVRVKLNEAFNVAVLSVSYQGCGFSTEQITRIGAYMQFDRRMHEQQGLGLGLSISKRLIGLHGGTLSIESAKGSGATVIVKLPKTKPAPENGSV